MKEKKQEEEKFANEKAIAGKIASAMTEMNLRVMPIEIGVSSVVVKADANDLRYIIFAMIFPDDPGPRIVISAISRKNHAPPSEGLADQDWVNIILTKPGEYYIVRMEIKPKAATDKIIESLIDCLKKINNWLIQDKPIV